MQGEKSLLKTVETAITNNIIELVAIGVIVATFFVYMLYLDNPTNTQPTLTDYPAFYTGATIVTSGEVQNLYDWQTQKDIQEFIYGKTTPEIMGFINPPVVAYLYAPLTLLPLQTGLAVFNILVSITLALCLYALYKIYKYRAAFIPAFWLYLPTLSALHFAQISIYLLALLIWIKHELRKHSMLAGALVGLLALKPQYLIFAPMLLLLTKSKKRFGLGFLISLGVFVIANSILYKPSFVYEYPLHLLHLDNASVGTRLILNFNLQSLPIQTEFLGLSHNVLGMIIGAVLYVFVLYKMYKTYEEKYFELFFGASIIFALTLNVHTMVQDLVFLLIPLTYLAARNLRSKYVLISLLVLFISPYLQWVLLNWVASILLIGVGFLFLLRPEKFLEQDFNRVTKEADDV